MAESSAKAQDKGSEKTRGGNKSASNKAGQISEPSLNMDELHELANLVDEHGFTDFEFENSNIRVRLSKNPAPQIVHAQQYVPSAVAASSSATDQNTAQNRNENLSSEISPIDDLHKITSPIVGTFYSSSAPDKEPYVKEGSKVSADTIVCIVEAMKLMNEIQAEVSGEIVKIYVENGQPVEYGQPLFGIRK